MVCYVITVKIGAKVMIRRNIDASLGLVNGTIGEIKSVVRAVHTVHVETIKIVSYRGTECSIERVTVKFQVKEGAFVLRKQFPLSLSYGITIHKSRVLSLINAIVDVGNTVFSSGQIYVALSRVTSMEGLHLINFDPSSIKASEPAILEYNRLRRIYKPTLPAIAISKERGFKAIDSAWAISKTLHLPRSR